MNSTFLEEIQDRLTALLTPRRTAFLTPRRNAQRTARRAQTGGTSRRIGFISSSSSSCSTAITTAAAATIGSPKIDKKGGQLLPGQKSACMFIALLTSIFSNSSLAPCQCLAAFSPLCLLHEMILKIPT